MNTAEIARDRLFKVLHDDRVATRGGLIGYVDGHEGMTMTGIFTRIPPRTVAIEAPPWDQPA